MIETDKQSIFDIEADEARLDAEAMAAYRVGAYVPHTEFRVWLAKLARGERVPPPEA